MAISITPSPFGSVTVTLDGELGGVLSVSVLATSNSVLNMDLGVPGPQGEAGEPGANGVGVPTGGSAGQVLAKIDGTNYNTQWVNAATGNFLPLSGGTMTGDIIWPVDGNGIDSQIGSFGFGVENTSGQTAYIEPQEVRVYDTTNTTGTRLIASGVQFNDSTTQVTAGLPLTGGTVTGNLIISGGDLSLSGNGLYDATIVSTNQINFSDLTQQTTAFPPAGGTTAQFIDGTGALTTFPTSIKTASQMVTSVRNNTGATLTKGTVVYINGAVGNKPTVTKAQANSEAGSKATYGFVETGIANNADGNVVVIGLLENIDTQGFADGTQIYLSPTVAGGWTSTQPFSPYHYVRLGTVIRGNHPTQGSIEVNIQNGFQLDEMSDVGAVSPTNNNVLTWVSASSQWLDRSITTILGYTPADVANYAYATTAQAQAGTSTTTVVSPATLLDARWFSGSKSMVQIAWSTSVSGTGAFAVAQNSNARLNAAPTTSTGYAIASAFIANNSRGTARDAGFDFSKRVSFGLRVARNVASPDTNSVWRFSIGKSTTTDASDLSARGLQVKVAGSGALQLLVHNGTTLTTTTSSYTPTNAVSYDIVVTSDGAGNCVLYVNGSSVATSSGGPTSAGGTLMMFEVQNTATITGSPQNICVSDYFVQVNV